MGTDQLQPEHSVSRQAAAPPVYVGTLSVDTITSYTLIPQHGFYQGTHPPSALNRDYSREEFQQNLITFPGEGTQEYYTAPWTVRQSFMTGARLFAAIPEAVDRFVKMLSVSVAATIHYQIIQHAASTLPRMPPGSTRLITVLQHPLRSHKLPMVENTENTGTQNKIYEELQDITKLYI